MEYVPSAWDSLYICACILADSAIEVGISSFPAATTGGSADDEPLLMDVMKYCLEGRTTTIDLAAAKAKFVDADVASLERSPSEITLQNDLLLHVRTCHALW